MSDELICWDTDYIIGGNDLPFGDPRLCIICEGVMRNAVQGPCQHPFGEECFRRVLATGKGNCPTCRAVISVFELEPARFARSMIDQMQGHCKYKDVGCEHQGTLESLGGHEKECQHANSVDADVPVEQNDDNDFPPAPAPPAVGETHYEEIQENPGPAVEPDEEEQDEARFNPTKAANTNNNDAGPAESSGRVNPLRPPRPEAAVAAQHDAPQPPAQEPTNSTPTGPPLVVQGVQTRQTGASADLEVHGAGVTRINGVYRATGVVQNAPRWTKLGDEKVSIQYAWMATEKNAPRGRQSERKAGWNWVIWVEDGVTLSGGCCGVTETRWSGIAYAVPVGPPPEFDNETTRSTIGPPGRGWHPVGVHGKAPAPHLLGEGVQDAFVSGQPGTIHG
eukprot:m.36183 g.36183  ORF g.36183 m.36183 type:complete len:393 (-) comp9041_c0_seq1:82-1260(-)